MPLTSRYDEAFRFAHELHGEQERKGTSIPYISHLMTVSALVIEHGGDEDQAIGALLHDAAEDQGGRPTLEQIRMRFGDAVAEIVSDCTDAWTEPKPKWRARKEAYITELPTRPPKSLLVSLADKVHNAEAILFDYLEIGDAIWSRFTGGADGTRWYYKTLADFFSRAMPGPLADRLSRAVTEFSQRTNGGDVKTNNWRDKYAASAGGFMNDDWRNNYGMNKGGLIFLKADQPNPAKIPEDWAEHYSKLVDAIKDPKWRELGLSFLSSRDRIMTEKMLLSAAKAEAEGNTSKSKADEGEMEAWERRALTGDFRGVPVKLTWKRSGKLAHFIDGYEIAGGQEQLIAKMQAKRQEFAQTGSITGTALDLWVCLFAEWRSDRWAGGYSKTRQETKRLNALSSALALRLRAATREEADALVPLFKGLTATP